MAKVVSRSVLVSIGLAVLGFVPTLLTPPRSRCAR